MLDTRRAAGSFELTARTVQAARVAALPVRTDQPTAATPNAIGAALGLLGDEWTLLIVRDAFAGVRRYGDWKRRLPIADAVLSARLGALVDGGVLERAAPAGAAHRREYRLSPAGLDLWQVLVCIWMWEQDHADGQSAALPHLVHTGCGRRCHADLRCARCEQPASIDDVDASFGPSGSFERSVPAGVNRRRLSSGRSSSGRLSSGVAGPALFPETMSLIGSRWSSATLGAAFLGATRFGEFERSLGAPPAIVADRLRSFVDLGVFDHAGPTYRLSAKGQALFGVVSSLLAWGERWMPAPDGPAVVAVHRSCGEPFVPSLGCDACGDAIARRTVAVTSPPPVVTELPSHP